MKTLELDTTSKEISALVDELNRSGDILFLEHNLPVAKLVALKAPVKTALKAGCLKGFVMSPDFDVPLPEFAEYME